MPLVSLRTSLVAALIAGAVAAGISCGGGPAPREGKTQGQARPAQAPASRGGAGAVEALVQTPLTSSPLATACAWNTARRFIAADDAGNVFIYDTESRRLLRRFRAGGRVTGLALGYDAKRAFIATAGSREIQSYNIERGEPGEPMGPLPAPATSIALLQSGNALLVGGADGTLTVWNVIGNTPPEARLEKTMRVSSAPIVRMVEAMDGTTSGAKWVGTLDGSGVARICNCVQQRVVSTLTPADKLRAFDLVALAADGIVAITSDGSNAHLWKPLRHRPGFDAQGNQVEVTEPPTAVLTVPSIVSTAAFSPGGMSFVVPTPSKVIAARLDGRGGFEVDQGFNVWAIQALNEGSLDRVALFGSGELGILDITHRTFARFPATAYNVQEVVLSPDGRFASIGAGAQELRTFDLGELRGSWTLPTRRAGDQWRAAYAPDGSICACIDRDGVLQVVDAATGSALHASTRPGADARHAFSADGKTLAIVWQDFVQARATPIEVERISAAGWKTLGTVALADAAGCAPPMISPDLRWVAAGLGGDGKNDAARKGSVRVWDAATGKVAATLKVDAAWVSAVAFAPDGTLLASAGAGGVKRFAAGTWAALPALARPAGAPMPEHEAFSDLDFLSPVAADGGRVAQGDREGRIVLWQEGKPALVLEGHRANVVALTLSRDGRFLLSGSLDGTARLWRLDVPGPDGAPPAVSLVAAQDDWIVCGDDGLFDASRRGGQLVSVTEGLDAFAVDQLALRLNRPDRLLERMGLGTPAMRASLAARAARRLKRAGLTEEAVSGKLGAPTAHLRSAVRTGARQAAIEAYLEDKADGAKGLRSYQVYVNDVPLFGAAGKPVAGAETAVSEVVALGAGSNKVEVSCTNALGMESFRAVAELEGDGAAAAGDLYVLTFGVSKYSKPGLALRYAHQDALDLAATLQKAEGKGFAKVHARALTDAQVTTAAIREAKAFLADAKTDDTVVLFVAGHGVHDATPEATYYYLTCDADPADLAKTAAPFELIEDLLQGIRPLRKLFLMDTCESGELDDDARGAIYAAAGSRGIAARGFAKGFAGSRAGTKVAPRPFLLARDRYIDNDLARRSGAIVFSSSRGGELSYESEKIGHGFFTEAILGALTSGAADANHDGLISTDELRAYVAGEVSKATDGAQNPTVDRDNIFARFGLPVLK